MHYVWASKGSVEYDGLSNTSTHYQCWKSDPRPFDLEYKMPYPLGDVLEWGHYVFLTYKPLNLHFAIISFKAIIKFTNSSVVMLWSTTSTISLFCTFYWWNICVPSVVSASLGKLVLIFYYLVCLKMFLAWPLLARGTGMYEQSRRRWKEIIHLTCAVIYM